MTTPSNNKFHASVMLTVLLCTNLSLVQSSRLQCALQALAKDQKAFMMFNKQNQSCRMLGKVNVQNPTKEKSFKSGRFRLAYDFRDFAGRSNVPLFGIRKQTGHKAYDTFMFKRSNYSTMTTWNDMAWANSKAAWYRSPLVAQWFNIGGFYTVTLALLENNRVQCELKFRGKFTTKVSWMQQLNLLAAYPWNLTKLQKINFQVFGVDGDPYRKPGSTSQRRFYVAKSFGGCAMDSGILGVFDAKDTCNYVDNIKVAFSQPPVFLCVMPKEVDGNESGRWYNNSQEASELRISAEFASINGIEHKVIYERV